MDSLIAARKLESLRRCLQRVEDKCPENVETLANDIDLQDIVVLNLSRAVQACVDLAMHIIASLDLPAPPKTWDKRLIALPKQQRSIPKPPPR